MTGNFWMLCKWPLYCHRFTDPPLRQLQCILGNMLKNYRGSEQTECLNELPLQRPMPLHCKYDTRMVDANPAKWMFAGGHSPALRAPLGGSPTPAGGQNWM